MVAYKNRSSVVILDLFSRVDFFGCERASGFGHLEGTAAHAVAGSRQHNAILVDGVGNDRDFPRATRAPENFAVLGRDAGDRLRRQTEKLVDTADVRRD